MADETPTVAAAPEPEAPETKAKGKKAAKVDFGPPQMEAETGVHLEGDYPVNHRLRAERLHADGKKEDPDGIVSPEAIVAAGERVAAEEARAKEAAKEEDR